MTRPASLAAALRLFAVIISATVCGMRPVSAAEDTITPEQTEFFEKEVRPRLAQHCLDCHGAKKQQAGLRLDSRAAMLKGNESGASLVPGKPQEGRFLRVIQYRDDDIQMPPAGKLAPEDIAVFTRWIEMGAPWPDSGNAPAGEAATAAVAKHWAFQPVTNPPVPSVSAMATVKTSVDPFIAKKLSEKGLSQARPADKATFIRRATLDLWGIPPTYAEVQAFVNDRSADATARLIDRLLDSPLYGERWARHWLDVARYADTKGYVFTEEPRYPYAYTYRDYVVESFNHDKPYDQFVLEQLAADKLERSDDQAELAALGFLTVGRRFLNRKEDIIDDRIDVITRGLMALTVGCARCHDHKYDPIPTADYYSLFGVLNSCQEPGDLPIIGSAKSRGEFEVFQKKLAEFQGELDTYHNGLNVEITKELREQVAAYLTMVIDPKADGPGTPTAALITKEIRRPVVERWKRYLNERKDPKDPIFGAWKQLTKAPDDKVAEAAADWLKKTEDGGELAGQVNPLVRQALADGAVKTKIDLAQVYGKLLTRIHTEWQALVASQADTKAFPEPERETLRQVLYGEASPTVLNPEETIKAYLRNERDKERKLVRNIENLNATSPGAPPRAMVLYDKDKPEEPRILIRGNPGRPGDQVPRQFLKALSPEQRVPFKDGSGRLELARAIVDPANPLTARVFVNRVWQHHFGEGLVRTPGDFGLRGEAPTHPELLDHLVQRFLASGWSIKSLHRLIMNSATYAQSSDDRPDARAIDPENRLLWRMPRVRLEFEAQRDSWLAAAGRLDVTLGGRPFDNINDPNAQRRTLYGFVNRNDLPGVFRSFDFADVDVSMAERPETTVPQQALFGMNSPFLIAQARHLAQQVAGEPDDTAKVTALFRRALSRDPRSEEREMALQFVKTSPHEGKLSNWDKLAQALLLTNEFVFVD